MPSASCAYPEILYLVHYDYKSVTFGNIYLYMPSAIYGEIYIGFSYKFCVQYAMPLQAYTAITRLQQLKKNKVTFKKILQNLSFLSSEISDHDKILFYPLMRLLEAEYLFHIAVVPRSQQKKTSKSIHNCRRNRAKNTQKYSRNENLLISKVGQKW